MSSETIQISKKGTFQQCNAFKAKILSWCFHHLSIVGFLLTKRRTKGPSQAAQDRPSYTLGHVLAVWCRFKVEQN